MKYCKCFIIIAFIFNGAFSNAQGVDTTAINLLSKLKVFLEVQKEIKNINTELLNKYLASDINVKYLKSNIYWIKFIEINIPTFADNDIEPINECKRFVIAITETRDKIYRLLNFKNNDVREFLRVLKYESVKHILFPKSISKDYYIEGVDLKCLVEGNRKRKINTEKYPCYHYCGEPIIF